MGIRILQIGAGIRGQHWAGFVKNHPDVECIALVEPDGDLVKDHAGGEFEVKRFSA